MKYPATVKRLLDDTWLARSVGEVGLVEASGGTRELALRELAYEIRDRLERRPRGASADDRVDLEVRELAPTSWRGTVF